MRLSNRTTLWPSDRLRTGEHLTGILLSLKKSFLPNHFRRTKLSALAIGKAVYNCQIGWRTQTKRPAYPSDTVTSELCQGSASTEASHRKNVADKAGVRVKKTGQIGGFDSATWPKSTNGYCFAIIEMFGNCINTRILIRRVIGINRIALVRLQGRTGWRLLEISGIVLIKVVRGSQRIPSRPTSRRNSIELSVGYWSGCHS